jgi:hypothetical protein
MLKAMATQSRVPAPADLAREYRPLAPHARPDPRGRPRQGRLFE